MDAFMFDDKKATQAAARIIEKAGGECNYLSAVKLLYIIDREALRSWGRVVSGGPYFSLPNGPVNSPVLDVVNGQHDSLYWQARIERLGNTLKLRAAAGTDALSEAEVNLIDDVFDMWGKLSASELVSMTHDFKEWADPNGRSKRIDESKLLSAVGKSADEAAEILADLQAANRMKHILG